MKNRRATNRIKNKETLAKDTKFETGRILKVFTAHTKSDEENFSKIINLIATANLNLELHVKNQEQRWLEMEPMIKVFNDNKIVRTRLSADFKTIVLYSAGITTIGGLFYGILYWLKQVLR